MAVSTFDVTADNVRTAHFPHWSAFSTNTKPTAAQVATYITEEAADLGGKLKIQSITPSGITSASATENAYQWCRKTLQLMVAVRVARSATASNPEFAKTLQGEVDARLESLDRHGATLLIDASAASTGSAPEGPTTHISRHSLTTADVDLMSTVEPRLRRDDSL